MSLQTEQFDGKTMHVQPRDQPTPVESQESTPEEYIQQLFSIPAGTPPTYTQSTRSMKPVALPRTSPAFDSPFARAYAPELQKYDITQEKWLEFVDGLSIAMIASPPLQILDTVGKIVGVVPFWPAMVAGIGTQVIAQTGQHVLSKTMTDKYLKRANAEYFHGRGLRVCLMKGEALKVFTGKTTSTPELSKKAKFGKGAEAFFTTVRLPIVTPIAAAILDAVKPLPQASTSSSTSSGAANAGAGQAFVERRMAPLQDLIAPVNFDVPPSALPEGYMQKASAYAVQRNLQKSSRGHHREDRRKALAAISRGEMTPGQYAQSLQGTCDYGRRGMKDQRKAIRKARKQERRMLRGKDNGKTERRANMAERRDIRRDDKLVWLVVYPIERDAEITGVEGLDSDSPLQMSETEYEEELEACEEEERESQETEEVPPPYHPA